MHRKQKKRLNPFASDGNFRIEFTFGIVSAPVLKRILAGIAAKFTRRESRTELDDVQHFIRPIPISEPATCRLRCYRQNIMREIQAPNRQTNGRRGKASKCKKWGWKTLCTALLSCALCGYGEARLSECYSHSLGIEVPTANRPQEFESGTANGASNNNDVHHIHSIRTMTTRRRRWQQQQQVNHLPCTKHHTIIDRTFNHTFEALSLWRLVYLVSQRLAAAAAHAMHMHYSLSLVESLRV